MSRPSQLAEQLYGKEGKKMQTADLYQRLAKDTVRAVAVIGVDTDPEPPLFDDENPQGIAGTFLNQVEALGLQYHAAVVDPIAYKIGYEAQMQDAVNGNYSELEHLAWVHEATTAYIEDQS